MFISRFTWYLFTIISRYYFLTFLRKKLNNKLKIKTITISQTTAIAFQIFNDTPLANLDEKNAKEIETQLLSIKDRTIIIISHQFSFENIIKLDEVIEFKQ
ncbi:MAG: hypothetical protein RIN55_08245 [Tissierellaceae bacterium]|nr:hypothetical protein [Tissierellaceae bacterium]